MHVKTESETVLGCREGVMEFLLVNHPLDCSICDQAGECRLQEFATDYGRGYSRFVERKNVKPKRTRLGPRVTLDDERCILCSRCIRFCQEVPKDDVLGFVDRGSFSTLTCFPGRELDNNYSLNTVDLCPVGALTSTDFRFKMRVWFLKDADSICPESSAGCNTTVSSREGELYRITPRRNDLVNDSWMPDSGRELYKSVKSNNRILSSHIDQNPCSADEAIIESIRLLGGKKIGIVGSCKSSLEEQFLLNQISLKTNAVNFIRGHFEEDDGILLSADRSPNLRGALISGFTQNYPKDNLVSLSQALGQNQLDVLLVIDEDLEAAQVDIANLEGVPIVFIGTHTNSTSNRASVVLPSLTTFEKSGTFVNRSFYAQVFRQAVPGPAGVLPDLSLLSRLHNGLTEDEEISPDQNSVWKVMNNVSGSVLKEISLTDVRKDAVLLDSSKWSDLPFVESKALHFEPATKVEA